MICAMAKKQKDKGRPKGRSTSQAIVFARVPQELKDKIIEYQQQQQVIPQESEVIRDLLKRGLKDVGLL